MRKLLICTACGARLTRPLIVRSGKDPAVAKPRLQDREPPVARGTAFKSYEPMVRSYRGTPEPLEFTPQYWLHPEDVTDAVRQTRDTRRLNGCCGPSGHDGPNQVCRCGAEVGTVQSDCWTAHVFIPEPDATVWAAHEETGAGEDDPH